MENFLREPPQEVTILPEYKKIYWINKKGKIFTTDELAK